MKHYFTIISVIVASVFIAVYSHNILFGESGINCPKKYDFISHDLNCSEDSHDQVVGLKESVNILVKDKISKGEVFKISVFYRDLNSKQWFGINENENFAPGSLLKLPLAMLYYKLAEMDPGILEKEYLYTKSENSQFLYNGQTIKPQERLESGKTYTVSYLVKNMIQDSNNEQVSLLVNNVDKSFFDKVYIDLGVFFPKTGGIEQDFVSVKTYGAILRSLYNASYLNQQYSNELLTVMSESSFRSGIAGGVPKSVKVSNKFGERVVTNPNSGEIIYNELHDCGIIYDDNEENYILCVMTKGKDFKTLENIISEISKKIYQSR